MFLDGIWNSLSNIEINVYSFAWKIIIFFALIIQKDKCICLSEYPTTSSLPLNQCNFDCLKNNVLNNSLECGGRLVYSVFVSGKWFLTQRFSH